MDIDEFANEIRRVDGKHSLGAGQLAEALWPYVSGLVANERARCRKVASRELDAPEQLLHPLNENN